MKGFYMISRDFLRKLANDAALTACDLRVIAAVMAQIKTPGDVVEAGLTALTDFTGQSRRNVVRSRARLIERGYLIPAGNGDQKVGLFNLADCVRGGDSAVSDSAVTDTPVTASADTKPVTPLSLPATIIHTKGNIDTTQNAAKKRSAPKSRKPKVTMTETGFILPEPLRLQWAKVYPELDLDREAGKAFVWCSTNPSRAPKKNFGRFLNSWFARVSGWKEEDRRKREPEYEANASDVALWVEFEKQIAKGGSDNV